MELMRNFPGLVKRGGVYYVRVRVPNDLRNVLGRRELKQSLQTKSVTEARRLYKSTWGKLLLAFEEGRSKTARQPASQPVLDAELRSIVRAWFFEVWGRSEKAYTAPREGGLPVTDMV